MAYKIKEKKHASSKTSKNQKPRRNKSNNKNAQDIAQAKEKAAQIREQGLKEYKEQLLKELENDTRWKMCIVVFLYFISLVAILAIYLSNTSYDEIEKWILERITNYTTMYANWNDGQAFD